METAFGHDFSRVTIHPRSGEAIALGTPAFTRGEEIHVALGELDLSTTEARKLLAHELAHVVQQREGRVEPTGQVKGRWVSNDEGLEHEADAMAERVARSSGGERVPRVRSTVEPTPDSPPAPGTIRIPVNGGRRAAAQGKGVIQGLRIPVAPNVPLCGLTLTHIDVEPPRWRDLQPCLPAGHKVYRMNIVGRQVTPSTTGRGRQVFNLHIGIYRNAAGRLCVIVDDSKTCIAPRCLTLGCFPTLQEVLDALRRFLETVLIAAGIAVLRAVIRAIIEYAGEGLLAALAAFA